MKIISSVVLVAAVVFAGCDSAEEKARKAAVENRAQSLEEAASAAKREGEREADAIEEGKRQLDRKAQAVRIEAQREAEVLQEAARKAREMK